MKALYAALARVAFYVGALGLLGAMTVDFAAIIGRHTGVPLLGSIELSEAFIVCMACGSLLGTTLDRGHVRVQLLTERLRERTQGALARLADALSALFFAFILGGSGLLVVELWSGDEQSELLHLPIIALRLLFCASALGMAACCAARALARRSAP